MFWTDDRTDYFCSSAHRKDARESVEVETVPVKITDEENARWNRNLALLEKRSTKRRRFKMDFGRGLRAVSA